MAAPDYKSFEEAKLSTYGTEITIDKPAGVVETDLMVAVISTGGSSITPPNGWSDIQEGASIPVYGGTYYKVAGASEGASYTFTWSGSYGAYGFIMRITGHDTTTPVNISALANGTSATPTCPTVTTTLDDCLLLRIFVADEDKITVDGGYPTGYEATGITVDCNTGSWLYSGGAAYKDQINAGVSGTAAFAMTASEQWIGITVAINSSAPVSASVSSSISVSSSPSASVSASLSVSASVSASLSASVSASVSSSPSASISSSPSTSVSASTSLSGSPSASLSASISSSPSASLSASPSIGTGDYIDSSGYGVYTGGGTVQEVEARFTNLSHLEGEDVKGHVTDVDNVTRTLPADDGTITVNRGIVDLSTADAHNLQRRAIIGLPTTYTLRPMRLVYNTAKGTSMGDTIRISKIMVSFFNTLGAKYGKSMDDLKDITFSATAYTGDKELTFDGGFDENTDLYISGNDTMPCTVRAIVVKLHEG